VGAEHVPQLLVAALVDQVDVHLAEGRQVAVGVVDGQRLAAGVLDLEAVVRDFGCVEHADPDAVVLVLQRRAAVGGHHDHRLRERSERAYGHASGMRVRAEDVVRVAVLTGDDLVEDRRVDRVDRGLAHDVSSGAVSRSIAPSGMPIQLGRLRAS
jgi:hypothetical protein